MCLYIILFISCKRRHGATAARESLKVTHSLFLNDVTLGLPNLQSPYNLNSLQKVFPIIFPKQSRVVGEAMHFNSQSNTLPLTCK